MACTWEIRAPPGERISLRFVSNRLASIIQYPSDRDGSCKMDSVLIYDGEFSVCVCVCVCVCAHNKVVCATVSTETGGLAPLS